MLKHYLKILEKYKTPKKIINHSLGVYRVSKLLVERLGKEGFKIEKQAVLAAAILHDVDKIYTKKEPQKHGIFAETILKPEKINKKVLRIIKNHTASIILEKNFYKSSLEDKLVYYADKIFEQKICSLEKRIRNWKIRSNLDVLKAEKLLNKMKKLEKEILQKANITFTELENLVS